MINVENYKIAEHEDGSVLYVADVHKVLLNMMKDIDAVCKKHNIPYWLAGGSALGAVRHQGFIPWDDDMDIAMMREDYMRFLNEAACDLPEQYVVHSFETNKKFNVCVPAKVYLKGTHVDEFNVLMKSKCEHGDGLFIDIFVCDPLSEKTSRDLPPRLYSIFLMGLIVILENLHMNPVALKRAFVNHAIAYGKRNADSDYIGYALTWCFNPPLRPVRYRKDSVFPTRYVPFEDTQLPVPKDPKQMLDVEIAPSHMSLPPEKDRKPKHLKDAHL